MRFYERNWFLWLSLILFAPFGIFVLWKFHSEESTALKTILTVIFAMLFVGGIIFGVKPMFDHNDKKPAKQTVEESPKEEVEETKESTNSFTFDKEALSVVVGEADTVTVKDVPETETVTWTMEDSDVAYVESSSGNRCVVSGWHEGNTTLHAESKSGSGSISVKVGAQAEKKSSPSVEDDIIAMVEESSITTGTNLNYKLKVAKDCSTIDFDYWFEGFSKEDIAENIDSPVVDYIEKLTGDYVDKMKDVLEKHGKDPRKTKITVHVLNGTSDEEGYKSEAGYDVTNKVLYTYVYDIIDE